MDVLVSDKLEQNSYEDPLEQPMILDFGHENKEEENLTLLDVNSQDAETVHCLESLKVLFAEVIPPKTSVKEPPDSELNLTTFHSEEVYSSSSSTCFIIISAELPPDKKEKLFVVLQKSQIGIGWPLSNFHDIMCSIGMQILLVDSAMGSFEQSRRLKSSTSSTIISTDLSPDKEESFLEFLQKQKSGSELMISNTQAIIYSLGMQIWHEYNVKGTFDEHCKLKFFVRDMAPKKIIKWPYKDVLRNFTLRCATVK
ncbi:hypothetical protein POM88_004258 [Heracleum sosnowskyi]|uniref:Uncharacterized protein n=1 Tax=Heracleum sosnowskyi TaxID=360622 RepID=A0AAD8JK08_9APIA|nr:hypothetical protein POM88_004258 [Heracleum sosnowskyi]